MAIKRITTNLIKDSDIATVDIANNAITAAKITDGNITTAKLADLSVTAGKLAGTLDLTGKTITVATATTGDSDTSPASTAFVQQEIAALVDSSPSSLNTLNELAAALGDDANFSTTVTDSIATKLPLAGGTLTGALTVSATTATINITGGSSGASLINFGDSDDGNVGRIYYDHTDNFMQFKAGDAERMRIDSTGNLLVGNTSTILDAEENEEQGVDIRPIGFVKISRSGNHPLQLARTEDGELIKLRTNENTVGRIGTLGGDVHIGSPTGSGSALRFDGTNNIIYASNASGNARDGALDLGTSSVRFKDLYLSGGVRGTSTSDMTVPETAGAAIKLEFGNNVNDTRRTVQAYKDNFEPAAADTGVIGLGQATNKWKDLHLSGSAYVDTNATFGGYVRTKQYLQVYEGNSQAGFIGKEKNIVGSGSSLDMVIFAEGIAEGGDLHFMTGGSATKRMSIDSSGNLLVGTTSTTVGAATSGYGFRVDGANGIVQAAASGNTSAIFNRTSSDGAIVSLRKNGSEVGIIGTKGGDLTIGTGVVGIRFHDSTGSIRPMTTVDGTVTDGTIDLGTGVGRFQDLYLSGGAYLGGTGSANHLDDYEEGTWTPACGATLSVATGHYTKIGNQVTVHYRILTTGGLPTSTSQVQISGLPFTIDSNGAGSIYARYYTPNDSTLTTVLNDGDTVIRLININEQSFDYTMWGELEASANNSVDIRGTATYKV